MAISTSIITGQVVNPSDMPPGGGQVIFRLSGFDTEGSAAIVPPERRFSIMPDGSLPSGAVLWQNTAGLRGTMYAVRVEWTEKSREFCDERGGIDLGWVQIGSDPSYDLSALLNATPPPAVPGSWWMSITQAQYDEMIAAAADAEAAAGRAEAAAADAVNNAPFVVKDTAEFLGKTDLVSGARYLPKTRGFDVSDTGPGDFEQAGKFVTVVRGELNFSDFGCSADKDSSSQFLKALQVAAGDPIRLDGTIRIDNLVQYSGPVNIWSPGGAGAIDASRGGRLLLKGGMRRIPNLAADIGRSTNVISFSADHGLSPRDVFCVWNPTEYSFNPARSTYYDGDWMEVAALNSTTALRIYGASPDPYAAADMECWQLLGKGVSLTGITFIPPSSGIVLDVVEHVVVTIEAGCLAGADDTALRVLRCYDVKITSKPCYALLGNAYPYAIANSKLVRVDGSRCRSDRHVVLFGGTSGPGSVPCRDIIVSGCDLRGLVEGTGASDAHGNVDNIRYIGCTIWGATAGGRNVQYLNNTIYGRDAFASDGRCVFAEESKGGAHVYQGNTFITSGDAISGIIYYSCHNLTEPLLIELKNNVVIHQDPAKATTVKVVTVASGTSEATRMKDKVDLVIDGLTYHGSALFLLTYCAGVIDVTDKLRVAVDGVVSPPCRFYGAASSVNVPIPLRLQRQSVKYDASLTTSVDSVVMPSAAALHYTYPRVPLAHASVYSRGTSMWNPIGPSVPIAYPARVRAEDVMLGVKASNGNFSQAQDVTISGEVWIADF